MPPRPCFRRRNTQLSPVPKPSHFVEFTHNSTSTGPLPRDLLIRQELHDVLRLPKNRWRDQESETFNKGYEMTRTPGCGDRTRHCSGTFFLPTPRCRTPTVREAGIEETTPQRKYVLPAIDSSYFSHIGEERIKRRLLRLSVDRDAADTATSVEEHGGLTAPTAIASADWSCSRGNTEDSPKCTRTGAAHHQTRGNCEAPGAGGIGSGPIAPTANR